MKVIKFQANFVPLVLSGEKTITWRLFDDKELAEGDIVELKQFGEKTAFATARLIKVTEKPFKQLGLEDRNGHEVYESDEEMYRVFSGYYKKPVGPETMLKIIWFELN